MTPKELHNIYTPDDSSSNSVEASRSNRAKPRSRVVFFRVSEDEMESMLRECKLRGARNVSELARVAVCTLISSSPGDADLHIAETLRVLLKTMADVQQTIQDLCVFTISDARTTPKTPSGS